MLIKQIIKTLLWLLLLPSLIFAQDINYLDALNQMFLSNGNIKASEASLEQKIYLKKSAIGLHMPQISFDAKYTHMNDKLKIDMSLPFPFPIGTQHINYKIQDQSFLKANISMLWPLFTGGQVYAGNIAANANYLEAFADHTSLKNDLAHDLTIKYFGLQLSREASDLRYEVYQGLKQHYDNALSKEKAGTIPKVERMHAEVSMNEAERNHSQALKDEDIARIGLKSLLSTEADITPVTPLFILDPKYVEPLEHFQRLAKSLSPQIQKLDAYQELATAGVRESQSTYFPNLYLFGNYEIYHTQLTVMDPEWYIGVGIKWDLFEGFSNHFKALASKKAYQSVLSKHTQAKRDLGMAAEVYYNQMLKAYDQYKSAKDTLEFTEEYLRVRKKSFESGFGTSIDVVDAQTALMKNKLDIMSAAYDFDVALSQLLALCGQYEKFNEYRTNANVEIIE